MKVASDRVWIFHAEVNRKCHHNCSIARNFGGIRRSLQFQVFSQKFRVEWYSCSFWSKIKGFNIPVYIPLTTSKGIEHQWSGAALLYSALGKAPAFHWFIFTDMHNHIHFALYHNYTWNFSLDKNCDKPSYLCIAEKYLVENFILPRSPYPLCNL